MWIGTVPGQEQMVLASRRRDDQTLFYRYTIYRAKRRPLTDAEAIKVGSVLEEGTQIIEVWQEALDNAVAISPATLPCPAPKSGDIWTDASGIEWVINARLDIGLFDERINTAVTRKL